MERFFFFGRGHRNIIKCTFHLVERAAPKWRALPPDDVQKAKGGESSELFVLIAANIQDLEGRCDAEMLKVALSSPLNVPEEMNAFIKKKRHFTPPLPWHIQYCTWITSQPRCNCWIWYKCHFNLWGVSVRKSAAGGTVSATSLNYGTIEWLASAVIWPLKTKATRQKLAWHFLSKVLIFRRFITHLCLPMEDIFFDTLSCCFRSQPTITHWAKRERERERDAVNCSALCASLAQWRDPAILKQALSGWLGKVMEALTVSQHNGADLVCHQRRGKVNGVGWMVFCLGKAKKKENKTSVVI